MLFSVEVLSVKVAGGELRSSASNKLARLAIACPGIVDVRFALKAANNGMVLLSFAFDRADITIIVAVSSFYFSH